MDAKKTLSDVTEKAGRLIRWLLLRPPVLAAGAVAIAIVVGLVLTCPSTPKPPPDPGEAARGAAAGSLPVEQGTPDAHQLLTENTLLRAKVDALEAEVGRMTKVFVVDARTKPFPVKAPPRASAEGRVRSDVTTRNDERRRAVDPDPASAQRVALLEGERIYLRLQGVGLRKKESGRLFLPATIGAYTADDFQLGIETIDVPLSAATELPPPAPRRDSWIWGGGPALRAGQVGAALLTVTPSGKVPFLPLRVRAWATPAYAGELILFGGVALEHPR